MAALAQHAQELDSFQIFRVFFVQFFHGFHRLQLVLEQLPRALQCHRRDVRLQCIHEAEQFVANLLNVAELRRLLDLFSRLLAAILQFLQMKSQKMYYYRRLAR